MAPWLRAHAALTEDLRSVPSTYIRGTQPSMEYPAPGNQITLTLASLDTCIHMLMYIDIHGHDLFVFKF